MELRNEAIFRYCRYTSDGWSLRNGVEVVLGRLFGLMRTSGHAVGWGYSLLIGDLPVGRCASTTIVMKPGYELFDHTADIGVRVNAGSMPELIPPAVDGLYSVMGEFTVDAHGPPDVVSFEFSGDAPEVMLRDLLAELHYVFIDSGRMVIGFERCVFDDERLSVTVRLNRIDKERSVFDREIKAITYHYLSLEPIEGGYQAVYIVDI